MEDKLNDGFKAEGTRRKKDHENLEENEEEFRRGKRNNGGRVRQRRKLQDSLFRKKWLT